MKSIIMRRIAAGMLCAGLLISFTPRARQIAALPDEIVVPAGQSDALAGLLGPDESVYLAASARDDQHLGAAGDFVTLSMWGMPVRRIALRTTAPRRVVPGGHSIGVALRTRGVLVVGVSDIATEAGTVCPARDANLRAGEAIVNVSGVPVNSVDEFTELLADAHGAEVELTISGTDGLRTARVTPVLDPHDNRYRLGAWVRDSTAGVGTLSFYDPSSARYGALGHAICDVDTGDMLTVSDGEILASDIVAIREGAKGAPGELRGAFIEKALRLGSITDNLRCGIYGGMYSDIANPLYPDGIAVSNRTLIHTGAAQLLTTLDEGGIRAYDCEITQVFRQDEPSTRSMVIRITDPDLISKTGGIVQGMSGSPLIQDGMLVGAVTHVFINDPTQGYGIYIDWMLNAADDTAVNRAA
jgi:stage IV sporulation protein B